MDTNNLTKKQQDIIDLLPKDGTAVDVATSQYSMDARGNKYFKPITLCHQSVLRSLQKRKIISVDFFYRGASVKLK